MIAQDGPESRKIQFSGKSSYMLSLPKTWVKQMKLQRGDQVTVSRQTDASLLVVAGNNSIFPGRGEAVIEVMPNESEGSLLRKVISLYLLGYGVIHVRASKGRLMSTQRQTVKETVRRHLIGTEVIADSTDGITIQILLSFPELSVENALKRMFLIAVSMHKDAIQALNEMDADVANGVIKTDDEVDRFSLYVIRQLKMAVQNTRVLKESGLTTPIDCLGYRLIVKSVERVADHASLIAKEILLIKSSLDKAIVDRIVELSNFAQGIFEESGFALFRRDYAAADRIVEKAKLATTMQSDILSTIEKSKRVHSYHTVRLIVDDTIRTVDYAGDIAEVVLNMTAEQAVVNG